MKRIIINALCFSIILSSCNQVDKRSTHNDKSTSIGITNQKLKNEVIDRSDVLHSDPQKIDTIIGDVHISYSIRDNDNIITTVAYDDNHKASTERFADRTVFVSIKKKNISILLNKKIEKSTFSSIIPDSTLKRFQLCYFAVSRVDDKEINIDVNLCVPDTDYCWPIEMTITNDGTITYKSKEVVEE